MTSAPIRYLVQERIVEREASDVKALQKTLEATITARFPAAPLSFALVIRPIVQPDVLHRLIVAVVRAPDLAAVEQELNHAMSPKMGAAESAS